MRPPLKPLLILFGTQTRVDWGDADAKACLVIVGVEVIEDCSHLVTIIVITAACC